MIKNKTILPSEIKRLSNLLDKQYDSKLNFRNHCYLRIAYDNSVHDKWDLKVKRPFTKFATNEQLNNAICLLKIYLEDEVKLLRDNQKSLAFRKEVIENSSDLKLF
ncbi:MAG: acetyltransferase [Flavobacterium sp.]|nr:acetyltransferase [Flavobacterium sp.]